MLVEASVLERPGNSPHHNGTVLEAATAREILDLAALHQTRFHWSSATSSYSEYLSSIPKTETARRGEAYEKLGVSNYNAAMQARNRRIFRQRMMQSLYAHKKARNLFAALGSPRNGEAFRCRGMEEYIMHWLSKSASKKKGLLEASWMFAKKSLRHFETSARHVDYAETYLRLSPTVGISFCYNWKLKDRVRKLREASEVGRKATRFLQSSGDRDGLVRVLAHTALFLDALADLSSNPSKGRALQKEALSTWGHAVRLSRDIAIQETASPPDGFYRIFDQKQILEITRRALTLVRRRRDNFATGWLLNRLTHFTFWEADSAENLSQSFKILARALHFAEETARRYKIINFTTPIGGVLWVHSPYAEYFLQSGGYEGDPDKSRRLLEKSFACIPELLGTARKAGYPPVIRYSFHVTARSANRLAQIETSQPRKKQLLRQALSYRIKSSQIIKRTEPKINWDLSTAFRGLADILVQLAEIEKNREAQRKLVRDAVRSGKEGVRRGVEFLNALERPEKHVLRGAVGNRYREYGNVLMRLYRITKNEQLLQKAAAQYVLSADWFRSIPRHDSLAEAHWKAAECYDLLQLFSLAAENFNLASKAYAIRARSIPERQEFFQDYSKYMKACHEIERARLNHTNLDFYHAAKSYLAAAQLHNQATRWSFLSQYYSGWSRLEVAEDLSKNGHHDAAIRAFQEAATRFGESRVAIKDRLLLLEGHDERAIASRVAASSRDTYCHARALIEEAVVAEGQEDYLTSSEKFELAATKLEEISDRSEPEQDTKEATFLSILCRAWRTSDRAELNNSAKDWREALLLFRRARDVSPNEGSKKLVSSHLAFCRAMIAGRKFAESLEPTFYEKASRDFDFAGKQYLDLGLATASHNALAQRLLLDASENLNRSSLEKNQTKRAELYRLAASLLNESSRAFLKARRPRKADEVGLLLEKTKEELGIAVQLTRVLNVASPRSGEKFIEPRVVSTSPILRFLAASFAADYARHFPPENCGWRTLMKIVEDVKIPRSHVYGERRYGRAFGRQLDDLVKSSLVEYRIFSGQRGRGGDITKVRIVLANDQIKRYMQQLPPTSEELEPSLLASPNQ